MAKTGIAYPVYAPVTAEAYGTSITYGPGVKVETNKQLLVSADISVKRGNKSMYGSNRRAEHDATVSSYEITISLTELGNIDRAALLGERKKTGSGDDVEYYDVGDENPGYVGFGYVQCRRVDGKKQFEAYWLHKVMFSLENENSKTQEEEIDFQPTELKGYGCECDLGDGGTFYHHMNFDTESAAIAWLNAKAGISA